MKLKVFLGAAALVVCSLSTWADDKPKKEPSAEEKAAMEAMMKAGTTSSAANTYEFTSTVDDPMTGKPAPMKEKVTVVDADHHTMEMWGPAPDGTMYKMMQIDYTRKK